jgi:quercetin dioxygenase-like cupin family protein
MTEWSVRNARELDWTENAMGAYCDLLPGVEELEFAINLNVLGKGQPMAVYHREPHQEGFLVLRGTCELIVEDETRELRQWDYVHCPPNVPHVIVGAGEEPALVLAVGSRIGDEGAVYPPNSLAARYGASTDEERDARAVYGSFGEAKTVEAPL